MKRIIFFTALVLAVLSLFYINNMGDKSVAKKAVEKGFKPLSVERKSQEISENLGMVDSKPARPKSEENILENADVEVININPRDIEENQEKDKSDFSKTYKLVAEVRLTNEGKHFEIQMDRPIEKMTSVVLIGGSGDGESQVSKVSLNGEVVPKKSGTLEDKYFEDDWKKLDMFGTEFKSIKFFGASLGEPTTIKLYLQYQGEIK